MLNYGLAHGFKAKLFVFVFKAHGLGFCFEALVLCLPVLLRSCLSLQPAKAMYGVGYATCEAIAMI